MTSEAAWATVPAYVDFLRRQHTHGLTCLCGGATAAQPLPASADVVGEAMRAAVAAAPALPTAPCTTCGTVLCCACGQAAVDASHATACPASALWAVAVGVESLRQVQLEVGLGRRPVKDRDAIAKAKAAARAAAASRGRGGYSRGRGGYGGRGGKVVAPPKPAPKPIPKPTVEWACAKCTFINKPGQAACEICATPWPVTSTIATTTAKPLDAPPADDWSCAVCTLINPGTAGVCQMCETAKPAPTAPEPVAAVSTPPAGPAHASTPSSNPVPAPVVVGAAAGAAAASSKPAPPPTPPGSGGGGGIPALASEMVDALLAMQLDLNGDVDGSLANTLQALGDEYDMEVGNGAYAITPGPHLANVLNVDMPYSSPASPYEVGHIGSPRRAPTADPHLIEGDETTEPDTDEEVEKAKKAAKEKAVKRAKKKAMANKYGGGYGGGYGGVYDPLEGVGEASEDDSDDDGDDDDDDDDDGYGPGMVGGTGYAGSAHEMQFVKLAALRRKRREGRMDHSSATILSALTVALNHLGMRYEAWATGATTSGDSAVERLVSTALQVLVGPGYADGLYLRTLPGGGPPKTKPSTPADVGDATVAAKAAATGDTSVLTRSKKYRFGGGDGVHGGSVLLTNVTPKLRVTMMDLQEGTDQQREYWFALVQLLQSLCRCPALTPCLVYSQRRDGNAVKAAGATYAPWMPATAIAVKPDAKTVVVSASSVAGLLPPLRQKASLYAKAASGATVSKAGASVDFLAGESANDALFLSLLGLAQDVQAVAEQVDRKVLAWSVPGGAGGGGAAFKLVAEADAEAPSAPPTTAIAAGGAGCKAGAEVASVVGAGGAGVEVSGGEGSGDEALGSDEGDDHDEDAYYPRLGRRGVKYQPAMTAAQMGSALLRAATLLDDKTAATDPTAPGAPSPLALPATPDAGGVKMMVTVGSGGGGVAPVDLTCTHDLIAFVAHATPAPPEVKAAYVDTLKGEAYDTVEGLAAEHALMVGKKRGRDEGGVVDASRPDPKRLMRVSAEMANLPDLAVFWDSSILVRTDESSMDLMRAYILGPPGTPYEGGWFGFDIKLTPHYPDEPPKVEFITTGGGSVRFNPNLYAEGKVCLSLLGTWSGPGWERGVSTLSQVLLSIQAQILVEKPYANEPGYESRMATESGRRAVAMHNSQLRLATIRHGMLDVLRRPPTGFQRAVRHHFWLKRGELKAQLVRWLLEVQALAAYEGELELRWKAAHAAWKAAMEAEAWARHEYGRWVKDTSVSGHTVFGWLDRHRGGMGPTGASMLGLPPTPAGTSASAFDAEEAAEAAEKAKKADEALESLKKQLVSSAYAAWKHSSSPFRPFAATFMHMTTASTGTPATATTTTTASTGTFDAAVAAKAVWSHVKSNTTTKPLLPPLTGARARSALASVLTSLRPGSLMFDCLVTTQVAGEEEGASAAGAGAGATTMVTTTSTSGGSGGKPALPNPFPICINASDLASQAGLQRVLTTLHDAFTPLHGKPMKSVCKLIMANPEAAMIKLTHVVDNKPGATSHIPGVPMPANVDDDPTYNPPTITYRLSGSGGNVPLYMYSPQAALAYVTASSAMGVGGGGGDGYGAWPGRRGGASTSTSAQPVDPWKEARMSFEAVRARRTSMISFLDLSRGMQSAVEEMFRELDALTEPE